MKFDEANESVKAFEEDPELEDWMPTNMVYAIIEGLREEYAPTVEMTKTQYDFITSEYEQENIVDAVANLTVDDILKENFHKSFWEPLTQREVVQSWLHPEIIKVVDK